MINHICDAKKEKSKPKKVKPKKPVKGVKDNNIETGEINNQKNNQLYDENKNSDENDESEEG